MSLHRSLWVCFALLVSQVHGQVRVNTDFEGGNAEVMKLDPDQRVLRIAPALREGRGWPCWWWFVLEGLSPGQEWTIEVQGQSRPFREKTVLASSWCQPKHAWISSDGQTWIPTEQGKLTEEKVMVYKLKVAADRLSMAWGPPFVPTDADKLLAELEAKLQEAKRFELAKTKGGRSVQGIRIGHEDAERQVWINARQHAWEAGGSQVGRGFVQWYASSEPEAVELRAKTCLHFIPIMDVDNVALGAGGKESIPRDHNRDWADAPMYPEIAAAQKRILEMEKKHGLDVFVDLHNPGPPDPIFFFGPFGFERMTGTQQHNYGRWVELAAAHIQEPLPVLAKYRFATYVTTEEERGRMSGGWVRNHTKDSTLAVTLETGWNSPLMTIEGYGKVGAGLGRTLAAYLLVKKD